MLDVGANAGYFTLLAASRVGARGRVVAFEPVPGNAEVVRKQCALNQCSVVTVESLAVGDRDGVATFVQEENNPNSHLADVRLSHASTRPVRKFDVQVTTLDSYLLDHSVAPDVVKVEVWLLHKWPTPWGPRAEYFSTGRDAFRTLLMDGATTLGWRRLWVPSYFCQEVVETFDSSGIEVVVYGDLPGTTFVEPRAGTASGDVLLVSNTFGLRAGPRGYERKWAAVVEDHTHDPWSKWSQQSSATFCVASLRKTLPIPDGAVLWSPTGAPTPAAPEGASADRLVAVANKFAAMVLKRAYLRGLDVSKNAYRRLFAAGESAIASGAPTGIGTFSGQMIAAFPTRAWREQRRRNFWALREALRRGTGLSVLVPERDDLCPFSLVLVSETETTRDALREHLIRNHVYPAVLWPISGERDGLGRAGDLSRRVLSVHCDHRYDVDDIAKLAAVIGAFERKGEG